MYCCSYYYMEYSPSNMCTVIIQNICFVLLYEIFTFKYIQGHFSEYFIRIIVWNCHIELFILNFFLSFVTECTYRYACAENRKAYKEMNETFEETYIGKVMEQILIFHQDKDILYKFDDEGDEVFEEICDKLNGLFNMKYSTGSQLSSSQTPLDTADKAEINVRTKATELIGRLACILWVYCKGINF